MICCVYKIYCKDPEVKETYIGSTKKFYNREQSHKSNCANSNSKEYNTFLYQFIRQNGGWDNFNMEIIEEFDEISKDDLLEKEKHYIKVNESKLNKNSPKQTMEERKEYFKQDKIKQQKKEYRDQNKDKIKERYEQNKNKYNQKKKEWYEKNKDKIKEYNQQRKQKVKCPYCNKEMTKGCLPRHIKYSCKHKQNIN